MLGKIHPLVQALALLACLTCVRATRADARGVNRFAIVIGSNIAGGQGNTMPVLSYADDDALNGCELFAELGMKVVVFARPDGFTQRRRGLDPPKSQPSEPAKRCSKPAVPTKSLVTTAIKDLVREVTVEHKGETNEIFVWFTGHGGSEALFLEDKPLTALDLRTLLLEPTRGLASVHLILDACGTRKLLGRGAEDQPLTDEERRAVEAYPSSMELAKNPHVGAVIAMTYDDKVHEWEHLEAGILSYEIRSALRGGADVNRDGKITYREVESFVAAVNAGVDNVNVRMLVDTHLPNSLDATLVDWKDPQVRVHVPLAIPGSEDIHLWIVDSRGVRIGETHAGQEKNPSLKTTIYLPDDGPPQLAWFDVGVANPKGDAPSVWRLLGGPPTEVDLKQLRSSSSPTGRGEIEALESGLFATAFDSSWFDHYSKIKPKGTRLYWERRTDSIDRGEASTVPYWSLVGGGVAVGGFGLFAHLQSNRTYEQWQSSPAESAAAGEWKTKTQRWDWTSAISLGVGGAAVATGAYFLIFDRPKTNAQGALLHPLVAPAGPYSLGAAVRF